MKIAVIGAGNGGQSIAGYLALQGYKISLYDIDIKKMEELKKLGGIQLTGRIEGFGKIDCITTDIAEAVMGAEIVMVTTVANAHRAVAMSMAPFVEDGQVIILNPGRTCGALVFNQTLRTEGCTKRYYLGEAQTLVYACRVIGNGKVNIIGVKDEVFLAGLPASDTEYILGKINPMYPCFVKADNVLRTSLENIGAMFHPCVCLFNAATIERQDEFWFYRDMTDQVARFIEKFDQERLAVGEAYGVKLLSVTEWIKFAYKDTEGNTLCERMKNNPAYHDIKAPGTIFTRQLTEDIPTGVLPIMELGRASGVNVPLHTSMVSIIEALLDMDLHTHGRSLKNLGLEGKSKDQILNFIINGE
ncbi:MAG: NAD/NADP octopine/nopaline dehydrogenase family protein [Bacteroidaceae bacterium]|nr:NAD/NADP octopine/nopaline dehydrogenase family protein [Bacteroidaceae bacterium]